MMPTIRQFIDALNLQPHPEGGWFSEIYRSHEMIGGSALPERYGSPRCFSTSIYFLLTGGMFSAFHRLKSDEVWHFYAGSRVVIITIDEQGNREDIVMGPHIQEGEHFQALIPAGRWFASFVPDPDSFALCGCTVAPGFDFLDFELADRTELIRLFPQHEDIIQTLTR